MIPLEAKQELKKILIAEKGEEYYNNIIVDMCRSIDNIRLKHEFLLNEDESEEFRKEFLRLVSEKYKDSEYVNAIMTLYDIALDTIL